MFAGLEECIKFLANFKLSDEEIDFVRDALPGSEVSSSKNECFILFSLVLIILSILLFFCFFECFRFQIRKLSAII